MNCQIPHEPFLATPYKYHEVEFFENTARNAFSGIKMPRFAFNEDGDHQLIGPPCEDQYSNIITTNLTNYITHLVPIFRPTPVACGNGLIPRDLLRPSEPNKSLFQQAWNLECKRRKEFNRKVIEGRFLKEQPLQEIPTLETFLQAQQMEHDEKPPVDWTPFQRILNRYPYDRELDLQVEKESYVGGNLGVVELGPERYLVHTVMEDSGSNLCLTRVTEPCSENYPLTSSVKRTQPGSRKDGIAIYQVAVHQDKQPGDEALFATRHLDFVKLWKVERTETKRKIHLSKVMQTKNRDGVVKSVHLNPYIRGEFCELRSHHVYIYRGSDRKLYDRLPLNTAKYKSCLYDIHPRRVLLASQSDVDLLDLRIDHQSLTQLRFTIGCRQLQTYWNLPSEEEILCFASSARHPVYYMALRSSVLVWDSRFPSRPLNKFPHMLREPPKWISTVNASDSDGEWLLIDSQAPCSSAVIGLNVNQEPLTTLSSSECIPSVTVELGPATRPTLLDSINRFRNHPLGHDDFLLNRLKQPLTGVTGTSDQDGNVQIWQCTAAGDVFVQTIDVSQRPEADFQEINETFNNRMLDWHAAVQPIESKAQSAPLLLTESSFFIQPIREKISASLINNQKPVEEDEQQQQENEGGERDGEANAGPLDAFDEYIQDSCLPSHINPGFPEYPTELDRRGQRYLEVWEEQGARDEAASKSCPPAAANSAPALTLRAETNCAPSSPSFDGGRYSSALSTYTQFIPDSRQSSPSFGVEPSSRQQEHPSAFPTTSRPEDNCDEDWDF